MLRAMRRLKRWALLLAVVIGSIAWLDQWLLAAGEPAPVEQPEQAERAEAAESRGKEAVEGAFGSRAGCEEALRARDERRARAELRPRGPRIATWNVRWFPRGSANGKDRSERTDVAWLACAIALLDVDVLAVQEILSDLDGRRAALDLTARLDELTGGRYRLELDDCAGGGRQHVGLLWNEERVTMRALGSIAALNPTGEMCAGSLRPGFGGHARFADGTDLHVVSVHLDSGEQTRDFENRGRSVAALSDVISALATSDRDALVLGDFNAMGCDACRPVVSAADELSALDAKLKAIGLERLVHDEADNRCSHYYRARAGLLDLAVASASIAGRVATTRADGVCTALRCERPGRGKGVAAWQNLSDHCPVVLELKPSR
jgi:endonuclease/exonuclease/phosphatase family metal-dependent hydrolase